MRRPLAAALAVALVAACSGGGGDDAGADLGVTQPPTSVTAPDALDEAEAGTGVVSIGGATSSFAVEQCQLTTTTDPTGLKTLVHLTGRGTTAGGSAFGIELVRFVSGKDVLTYTDTLTYTDGAKVLQAQRYEVDGLVNDLRDTDARASMVRTRAAGVAAQGVAGPPGTKAGDEGIVGIAVDASCPA